MNAKQILCPINLRPARHYASKGRAEYYIEPVSGVIFQSELPSVAEMRAFNQHEYQDGAYRAYSEMEALKRKTAEWRLQTLRRYGRVRGRLLDVGCSVGFFLDIALEAGFDVEGIELSSEAIAKAKDNVRSRISQADANEYIHQYRDCYGVVTAFDILEHTQHPELFLKDLFNALEPGGVLAISTPDTDHFLRYLMGRNWSMLQPMQHTFLFSKRAIASMLTESGFEDVVVGPAKKTLTLNYLFGQLSQTNPVISKFYSCCVKRIPSRFGDAPMNINISEAFAMARKRELKQ